LVVVLPGTANETVADPDAHDTVDLPLMATPLGAVTTQVVAPLEVIATCTNPPSTPSEVVDADVLIVGEGVEAPAGAPTATNETTTANRDVMS
jgi:hypothetical protein